MDRYAESYYICPSITHFVSRSLTAPGFRSVGVSDDRMTRGTSTHPQLQLTPTSCSWSDPTLVFTWSVARWLQTSSKRYSKA